MVFIHDCFPGLTNYPIGVGINLSGEVTIADNHNNFNLSVFNQVRIDFFHLNDVNIDHNCSFKTGRPVVERPRVQGQARPVLRRGPDGRRLGGAGVQGLQALHLQIRAGAAHGAVREKLF